MHGRIAKSLIVRSNEKGETIAAVFIKQAIAFKKYPEVSGLFKGLQIYYSNPLSPASTPDKLLYSDGQDFLIAKMHDKQFKFGVLSFFQVNIPVFLEALSDIKIYALGSKKIIDYYAGVGAIGLSLEGRGCEDVTLVEINSEAHEYTKENIKLNNSQALAILSPSEQALDYITPDATVIVDPPRAGLHPKFVEKIIAVNPEKLIYLSCVNPFN